MNGRFWSSILHAIAEPFVIVLAALQRLIQAVLTAVLYVPTKAFHVLTQRLVKQANGMDASLDAKAEARKKTAGDKQLDTALERLYYSDDFILYTRQVKKVKNFIILLLQAVSFVTTYRGLVQVTSSMHFAVPLLWAVVIQTGLTYLSATINSECVTRTQKALLAVFLTISIAFSLIGISESMIPYSEYAQELYGDFSHVYEAMKDVGELSVEAGNNPAAEIEGEYGKVDQLLSDAREYYSEEVLHEAEENLEHYKGLTVAVTVELPTYTYYDESGNLVQKGGGTTVKYVPDPDAKPLIQAEEENIRFIKEQQTAITQIETLISGSGSQEAILSTVESQINTPDTILPEFTVACSTVEILEQKCGELAAGMGTGLTVDLDLYELLQGYRDSDRILAVEDMTPFREIYAQWQESEYRPADTGIDWLDDTLAIITANDPSRLKALVDQTVTDHYDSLVTALNYVGAADQAEQLRATYEDYCLATPINYAFSGLRPSDENFQTSVLALIIALCNDGLAVAVGLYMERKKVFWAMNKTMTRAELMPHLFPHFRTLVLPEIRKRITGEVTFEAVRFAFAEILSDYLNAFTLAPQLVSEGFTRYMKFPNDRKELDAFLAFLLTRELAKAVAADEAARLGVPVSSDSASGYLLLTSRAEGWLTDLLGSASELGYSALALSK